MQTKYSRILEQIMESINNVLDCHTLSPEEFKAINFGLAGIFTRTYAHVDLSESDGKTSDLLHKLKLMVTVAVEGREKEYKRACQVKLMNII